MTKPTFLLITILAAACALAQPKKGTLSVDLQAAIQKESVQGDLKGAIAMYEKIVARAGSERDIAAKALLRIGQCQEKLGSAEARKAYERLLRDFGDQSGAAEARTRLAALGGAAIAERTIYSSSGDIHSPRPNRDGRFVAALCKNAICLFDVAAGTRKEVVPAPSAPRSRNWRPLPSPDGQSLAYVHFSGLDGYLAELRVTRIGQSAETILVSGHLDTYSPVDWTADGKSILYAKIDKTGSTLLLIPASGGAPHQLSSPDFDWASGRDNSKISPDGKWLAYPVSKRELQGTGYLPTDVRVMPISGGEAQTVFDGTGDERVVGWLANGDLVATSNRNGKRLPYRLHIVDGKLSGEPQLLEENLGEAEVVGVSITTGALFISSYITESDLYAFKPGVEAMRKFPLGYQAASPSFSPDGKKLAYATGSDNGPNSVVIRDLASGEERRLPGDIPSIRNLGWYPNGRHVFAICDTGNYGSRPTFRFDTVTGEMKPLPNVVNTSVARSPAILADGKTLVYASFDRIEETNTLRTLDTETGDLRALFRASPPYTIIATFAISPDRKKIVYAQHKHKSDDSALIISDLENPQPRIIYECHTPGCASVPFFTPDQRSIVYWRDRRELWQMPVEGGPAKLLRKLEWTPDGPAFHPTSGEIIVGVGTSTSQLRVQPARIK